MLGTVPGQATPAGTPVDLGKYLEYANTFRDVPVRDAGRSRHDQHCNANLQRIFVLQPGG